MIYAQFAYQNRLIGAMQTVKLFFFFSDSHLAPQIFDDFMMKHSSCQSGN